MLAKSDGIAAAYYPYFAGIPASSEYASPWGSANSATDIPATKSPFLGQEIFKFDLKAPIEAIESLLTLCEPGQYH